MCPVPPLGDPEVFLSLLTTPFLAVPLLLEFFADGRARALQDLELQVGRARCFPPCLPSGRRHGSSGQPGYKCVTSRRPVHACPAVDLMISAGNRRHKMCNVRAGAAL